MARPNPIAIVVLLFASSSLAPAADWPMFRGPDRNGVSPEARAPLNWSADKNVKWKAELPQPGNSSPIVASGKVFITCAEDHSGSQRSIYCFDRIDGKPLWKRTVTYQKKDPTHDQNPYCGASPATDGKIVVAWHGSAGLHAYDLEGKPLWSRDLGVIRHIWGWAGSPVIHGDAIYLNCGPGERTFVAAIDKRTGEPLWQTDEPGGAEDKSPKTGSWLGSWSTPVVAKVDGQEQLLVNFPGHVNAYDFKSGKILWTCDGNGDLAYTDVMIDPAQQIAVAMGGFTGPAIGFKLTGGSGNITDAARLWRTTEKIPQRIGSGVILDKHLYLPNEPYLACYDVATGKELWRHSIPGQQFWGSIVSAGERLYVTSKAGVTVVFAADPKEFRLLATNDLAEASNSTPAVSDGQIFLRTAEHLWCVEEK
jgi:outer membrane protein assembly factor BamB